MGKNQKRIRGEKCVTARGMDVRGKGKWTRRYKEGSDQEEGEYIFFLKKKEIRYVGGGLVAADFFFLFTQNIFFFSLCFDRHVSTMMPSLPFLLFLSEQEADE